MTTPNFNRYAWLAGICGMLVTSVSYTSPGAIADAPLFTATSSSVYAPSNIVFLLDDSGSMNWDYVYRKNWDTACYTGATTGCTTANDTFEGDNGSGDWRDDSKDVNILAYNPSVTYTDWKKGDGTYYHATTSNPNGNAALSVIPSNFSFEIWTDNKGGPTATSAATPVPPSVTTSAPVTGNPASSGTPGQNTFRNNKTVTLTYNITSSANGVVDYWDTHTNFKLTSSTATAFTITQTDAVMVAYTQANTPISSTSGSNPNKTTTYTIGNVLTYPTSTPTSPTVGGYDASVGGFNGRTLAQEKQNIANWYQYYRTRLNVAKGAIGSVVDANPNYRYGLNTIWNAVFVEVPSQYSSGTTVRTDFVPSNVTLLTTLYGLSAGPNTPLPDALERVGMYYAGQTIPKPNSSNTGNSSISSTSWTAATTSSTTSYAKPIVYECQQNYAILLTDGYWNQQLGSTSGGITSAVNNYVGANGHKGDVDQDGVINTTTSGGTSTTGVNATLADVARYYYMTDLDTTMANKVPFTSNPTFSDPPGILVNWQHMVTFTIAFGLQGVLVDTDTDPKAAGYGWPNPLLSANGNWGKPWGSSGNGGTYTNIDDLWHAAYNSRGLYVSASSPEAVAQGFADILSNISKRDYAGSASSASFNLSSASGSNSAYVSQYGLISNIWSGDLLAFTLNATTGLPSTTTAWSAATQLDALNTTTNKAAAATSRHIFTYNPALKTGVPFQWASLSAGTTTTPVISLAQQDLGTDTSGTVTTGTVTTPDAKALARLNYLRGDQTNEGTAGYSFRTRSYTDTASPPVTHNNLLGDIIHSDPLLVSTPQGAWPARSPFVTSACTPTYKSFKTTWGSRAPMVYAGANDGMLHAFNALNGNEAMAYIPNILFSSSSPSTGLHYLTDPRYTGQNHRYYVDGPAVVEDVCINTTVATSSSATTTPLSSATWHTVLVGGLNEGGRGVYALDITDPSLFNTENATNAAKIGLWEFDNTDDADMGYSFSVPIITMMNNGRWAAVFGNGYNSASTSTTNVSSGKAALFIVFLEGGFDNVWTLGTDYIKILLPTPSTNSNGVDSNGSGTCIASNDNCNGLSTVQTIDLNADGVIDRVYGGDLKGQMWAIDVSSASTGNWGSAYGTTTAPAPLFTASHHVTPYTLDSTGAPTVATGLPAPCGFTTASPTVITCSSTATFTSRTRQPITTRPTLLINNQSYGYNPPNVLVMFGTGQYLNLPDTGNTDMQTFYGVWDHGVGSLTPATAKGSSATTPAFVEQIYLPGPFYDNSNPPVDISSSIRVLSNLPVAYSGLNTTNQGWFINLSKDSTSANRTASQGERQIVNTDILDAKYLFFNTWIPGATTNTNVSANTCQVQGNSAGSGYLMSVSLFTGGAADKALFSLAGGMSMSGNNSAKSTDGTKSFNPAGRAYTTGLPAASNFVKGLQYTPGTNAGSSLNGTAVVQTVGDQMRRRAWQELRNN